MSISLNKPSTLAGFLECFKIFYPLIRWVPQTQPTITIPLIICTHPYQLLNQPLDVWLKVPFIREIWRRALPFPHPKKMLRTLSVLGASSVILPKKLMNYTTQNEVATKYNFQTARASFSSSYSMYSHKQVLSGGTNSCWQDSPVLFMIWVLHVML